jgi:hypothetical protein
MQLPSHGTPIHGLAAVGAVSDQRAICMDGQRIRFLRSADVMNPAARGVLAGIAARLKDGRAPCQPAIFDH